MDGVPSRLGEIVEMLELLPGRADRIELLIDTAGRFHEVPAAIATRPFPKERLVPGCESQAYVWAEGRDDGTLDERDHEILSGSQSLRSAAILITLVIWLIGLQETFRAEGAVPIAYLYLVFWSCLVVSLLEFPLGILVGYRRQ